MNAQSLYAKVSSVVNQTSLEIRVRRVLRDFILGTLVSGSCLLDEVAQALTPRGPKESQYRRLQRFLANPRVNMSQLQQEWTRVVLAVMKPSEVVLLVDETALSDHLKIMVVGIWAAGGCVPIAWRSYRATAYPAEGQVGLISDLLDRVLPVWPHPLPTILMADRGIGTSPDLIRAVEERGLDVVFRVQGSTRFRRAHGQSVALRDLGLKGAVWQSVGEVFKKAGWLTLTATVAWGAPYNQPWCLVSSQPLNPALYGRRFDQEVSFRDLKSDGFHWHRSHVWLPDHADRLLFVLAIAYWLVMTIGQALPAVHTGRQARLSTFRRGLDVLRDWFHPTIASLLPPPPIPPPRITSVVY